ncbi:hypothetical protein SMICM304S_07041 [Streptomyces microflavus]
MSDLAGNASANGNAVYTAVECADAKWPTSWRTWDRDNTRLHKIPFMTSANAWIESCPVPRLASQSGRPR